MRKSISVMLFVLFAGALSAQPRIQALRVYANDDEYRPPVIDRGEQVTVEFDVAEEFPPNVRILFRHASMDWKVDENPFVNEVTKIRSEALYYTAAPAGVHQYRYRYKNTFPNTKNMVVFTFSGNYIISIIDAENGDRVLAEARCIVAETTVPVSLSLENRYHPDFTAPMNQRLQATVSMSLPQEFTAAEPLSIDPSTVRNVAIIKNWEFDRSYWIGQDDNDPETFVENLIQKDRKFIRRDLLPGNEYRRMDLSSPSFYPNGRVAVLREGPDVSRFQWPGKPDANGAAKLRPFVLSNSEYLETEVRLRLPEIPARTVSIVGPFSQWQVRPEFALRPDSVTGLLVGRMWLPRGVYDYQYVIGTSRPDGSVTEQDWTSLEGNDWRTINRYTALVYANDRRNGGVDRVIGWVRTRNAGTSRPTATNAATNPEPPPTARPRDYQTGQPKN